MEPHVTLLERLGGRESLALLLALVYENAAADEALSECFQEHDLGAGE